MLCSLFGPLPGNGSAWPASGLRFLLPRFLPPPLALFMDMAKQNSAVPRTQPESNAPMPNGDAVLAAG